MRRIVSFVRRGDLVLLLLALLVITACSSASDTTSEEPSTGTMTQSEDSVEDTPDEDLSEDLYDWMTGEWIVDFSLTSVTPDADWSRQAANQPSAQWRCRVEEGSMVIDAGMHVYTGIFSVVDDSPDEWLYDGESTWLDEEGVLWTSHIVVEGRRESDDAFSAEQGGQIISDSEGTLYTAEWEAIGTRVPQE